MPNTLQLLKASLKTKPMLAHVTISEQNIYAGLAEEHGREEIRPTTT
jgi:hypothetical protein